MKNRIFNSGNEALNLNLNKNLEMKLQLQKIAGIEASVLKTKGIFNKEANGQNGFVYHFHVIVVPWCDRVYSKAVMQGCSLKMFF